jgi:type VII secretion integral membrane protein EccD
VTVTPETVEPSVVSAAPELVRLSLLGGRTQVDVSLPLDVPVAGLIPQLAELIRSGDAERPDGSDDPFAKEAKHTVWVLSRHDATTALTPSLTLRRAGVLDGELLRLTTERTLSAPTLYDDVVDAAARLNKAGYLGWDATAARRMTFAGIYLASGTWTYFLVSDTFAGARAVLLGLSVVAALALVGVATSAHRSYRQKDVGAALGWAALPIFTAIAWAALAGLGGYEEAAGCGAMVIVAVAVYRAVGTGHWGYLAAETVFVLSAIALALHAAGVRADIVGAGMAVLATSACLTVSRLPARMARFKLPPDDAERGDQTAAENSAASLPAAEAKPEATAKSAAGDGVWARVQSATLTRSAVYAGLAVVAGLGASVILMSPQRVQWSGLAFSVACAATLGLFAHRPTTAVERAALAIPAVGLLVFSCARAQDGGQPMGLAGFAVLLASIVVFAVIGTTARGGRAPARVRTLLAYLTYLSAAALIPLALWVVGVYPRLGIR